MSCSTKRKSNCVTIDCSTIGCVNKKIIKGNDDSFTLEMTEIVDEEIIPIILSEFDEIEMDIFDSMDSDIILMTKNLDNGLSILEDNFLNVNFNGNDFIDLDYSKVSYDILLIKDGFRKTYIEGSIFIRKVGTKRVIPNG